MSKALLTAVATLGLAVWGFGAQAEYPERTISIMVPFGAGGGTDVPGRFFAAEMEKVLGVNIVVTNVVGAGGTVGATQLSQAKADGYKLGFMPVGTMTTQPHLRKTRYNAQSWAPICLVAQDPKYVTVLGDSPITSMDDLIAKAKSGRVITGGPPPGSIPHIAQAAVARAYGVKFSYIPHQDVSDVVKSMLGKRVDMTVWYGDAKERFGLRPLAIMDSKRSDLHPDVPTLAELGKPVVSAVWFGFFAPAGTPEGVVKTLSDACDKAVNNDTFRANMAKAKRLVRYMPTDEFSKFFLLQYEQNGSLLKDAGLIK